MGSSARGVGEGRLAAARRMRACTPTVGRPSRREACGQPEAQGAGRAPAGKGGCRRRHAAGLPRAGQKGPQARHAFAVALPMRHGGHAPRRACAPPQAGAALAAARRRRGGRLQGGSALPRRAWGFAEHPSAALLVCAPGPTQQSTAPPSPRIPALLLTRLPHEGRAGPGRPGPRFVTAAAPAHPTHSSSTSQALRSDSSIVLVAEATAAAFLSAHTQLVGAGSRRSTSCRKRR